MASRESCYFPDRVFVKLKSKMKDDCCVFQFLWRSVDIISQPFSKQLYMEQVGHDKRLRD